MNKKLQDRRIAILGLGASNLPVITYLVAHDIRRLTVFDTRQNPPFVEHLPRGIDLRLGPFSFEQLREFELLIVSPGLSIHEGAIAQALSAGIEVIGDVELFAHEVRAPVVGVTGSNGKSTVTALVAWMAQKAGINALAGANFGNSVFDILSDEVELYVLELSSFELETTRSLQLRAGVILNVSPDHLDRYAGSIERYAEAKQRIFMHCEHPICNRDDPRTYPGGRMSAISFGRDGHGYGLVTHEGRTFLACGGEPLIAADELKICGEHNQLNALAALAVCDCLHIERTAQYAGLMTFQGLAHRCQKVRELDGITFYNDSKATNVASTEAAIAGLRSRHRRGIILLAGGQGKGQDFTPLRRYLGHEIPCMFCFGRDARELCDLDSRHTRQVVNMRQALKEAYRMAAPGQAILLSPACASLDQFKGYDERGRVFVSLVNDLAARDGNQA